MKNAVFAGTFDPLTIGHVNIINKCLKAYGRVIVVVGENPDKKPLFPRSIRLKALKAAFGGEGRVDVLSYADVKNFPAYLKENGVTDYVRGIRNDKDLKYEHAAEEKNRLAYPDIKTSYVFATDDYKDISSTKVREMIKRGEDFSALVPAKTLDIYSRFLKENSVNNQGEQ